MSLSLAAKKNINTIVPLLSAAVVAYLLFFRLNKNWKMTLIFAALAWLVVYIITSKITKTVFNNGPAPVPTGGGCNDYDPTALIDGIHEDITCFWCVRNRNLYDSLLKLADCQLITAYNYWTEKYYSDINMSLPVAIDNESSFFDSDFGQQQKSLQGRFSTLNLS